MISRRSFSLGMSGAAFGLAGLPAFGNENQNLDDPDVFLQTIIKMRGSTDSRLCMGWVTGTRYAVIDHKAVPIMGLMAATFTQYRKSRPGVYEAKSLEIAYFIDLKTRKLLETWRNPFTDRVVDVPKTRMGPAHFMITAEGLQLERSAGEAVGMAFHHQFRPAFVRGNDVWITEVIDVEGKPEARNEKPFVYNEMTTYHAKLSDLLDPAQATVPTNVAFHGLVTFRPWMGFGDMPGHTTAHGDGARSNSVAELPEYYVELTREFHPDFLEDPLAALNAGHG